jgi:transcriptional regulator with XRE-family HTH domain
MSASVTLERHSLGELVRYWRRVRAMSQLDLAAAAATTPRYMSFVETGRSQPSREMVLRVAAALDVPLRDRNGLLVAAGFAPIYRNTTWRTRDSIGSWQPSIASSSSTRHFRQS